MKSERKGRLLSEHHSLSCFLISKHDAVVWRVAISNRVFTAKYENTVWNSGNQSNLWINPNLQASELLFAHESNCEEHAVGMQTPYVLKVNLSPKWDFRYCIHTWRYGAIACGAHWGTLLLRSPSWNLEGLFLLMLSITFSWLRRMEFLSASHTPVWSILG